MATCLHDGAGPAGSIASFCQLARVGKNDLGPSEVADHLPSHTDTFAEERLFRFSELLPIAPEDHGDENLIGVRASQIEEGWLRPRPGPVSGRCDDTAYRGLLTDVRSCLRGAHFGRTGSKRPQAAYGCGEDGFPREEHLNSPPAAMSPAAPRSRARSPLKPAGRRRRCGRVPGLDRAATPKLIARQTRGSPGWRRAGCCDRWSSIASLSACRLGRPARAAVRPARSACSRRAPTRSAAPLPWASSSSSPGWNVTRAISHRRDEPRPDRRRSQRALPNQKSAPSFDDHAIRSCRGLLRFLKRLEHPAPPPEPLPPSKGGVGPAHRRGAQPATNRIAISRTPVGNSACRFRRPC